MRKYTDERCWVLVVADDLATRGSVADTLNVAGFPTIGVATAHEAQHWLSSGDPDPSLLIVEGEQNVLDSVRLRDLQQPTPAQSPIPIVVLLDPRDRDRRDESQDGIEVVPKPVNLEQLVARVAHWCER